MKLKIMLLSICLCLLGFMLVPDMQSGFAPKCGLEQAYAMGPRHPGPGRHPRHNPTPVPEPSGLIMLGIGLAAVGGYFAFRSRKK